jgi:hypothetical protein
VHIPQQGDAQVLWITEATAVSYLPTYALARIQGPGGEAKHHIAHFFTYSSVGN